MQQSDMTLVKKHTHTHTQHTIKTNEHNTIQYNKQMSILQSPKSNTVHNIIIIIIIIIIIETCKYCE